MGKMTIHGVEVLGSYWFMGGGVVLVNDPYDGKKAYVSGDLELKNEHDDISDIVAWGSHSP